MQNLTLYAIDEELRALLLEVPETGEVDDEWIARFEEMKGERGKKLEGIAHVRNSALCSASAIDMEIERLTNLKKSNMSLAQRMQGLIENTMKNAGETEIKTDLFKAKFVKNPPSLVLSQDLEASLTVDLREAEQNYKELRTEFSDKKKDLKDRLKAGEEVDGARLEQSERLKID